MRLSKKQKRIARVSAPFNKITGADIKSAQQDAANNPYNTLNQPNFVRGDSPYMAADTSGLAPTMNHAPTQAYIQNQNSMNFYFYMKTKL